MMKAIQLQTKLKHPKHRTSSLLKMSTLKPVGHRRKMNLLHQQNLQCHRLRTIQRHGEDFE